MTNHVLNLLASNLEIFSRVKRLGLFSKYAANACGHCKSDVGVDVDFANSHLCCAAKLLLGNTNSIGKLTAKSVYFRNALVCNGGRAVKNNGEAGKSYADLLKNIKAKGRGNENAVLISRALLGSELIRTVRSTDGNCKGVNARTGNEFLNLLGSCVGGVLCNDVILNACKHAKLALNYYTVSVCIFNYLFGKCNVILEAVVRAVDHNRRKATVNAGFANIEICTVVKVKCEINAAVLNCRARKPHKVCVLCILACACGNLKNNGGLFLGSSLGDSLDYLHIIDVEGTDSVSALVSLLEHFLRCYKCHFKSPSVLFSFILYSTLLFRKNQVYSAIFTKYILNSRVAHIILINRRKNIDISAFFVYNYCIDFNLEDRHMKIKAVLIDMDGTLLGKSQVAISVRNMTALQRAIEKGVQIIPCTGRVYDMLPPQLLTQEGLRYFVTSHGARAYDRELNTSIYEDLIPAEESARVMQMLEGKGLYNEIAADGTIYFEKAISDNFNMSIVPEHHIWYIRDNCYTAVERPSEHFLNNGIGVEKMNIYGIPKEMQESIYNDLNATGFIKHTRPGAGPNLEFSHYTLDKLKATDAILSKLGISYDETFAIGDSSSDIEIIKRSAVGIAMGNAPDYIKELADGVTGINTEDGVAEAFEKYIL